MRLFFLFYSLIATALSGVGVVLVLVLGTPGWTPILTAAGLGALLSVPVTWVIAKKIATL